jgi:hypothetical protein
MADCGSKIALFEIALGTESDTHGSELYTSETTISISGIVIVSKDSRVMNDSQGILVHLQARL